MAASSVQDCTFQGLCEASSIGDLNEVKTLFAQWQMLNQWPNTHEQKYCVVALDQVLVNAAENNRAEVADFLLSNGLHANSRAAVNTAIKSESVAVLQVLLDHGWKINESLSTGHVPGLLNYRILRNERLFDWFVEHGADPNIGWIRKPLDEAARLANKELIAKLISCGGDLNQSSVLNECITRGEKGTRYSTLEYLLKSGADINAVKRRALNGNSGLPNTVYVTPLHDAISSGQDDLVHLLLARGADPAIRTRGQVPSAVGYTAAELAEITGRTHLIPVLLDNLER